MAEAAPTPAINGASAPTAAPPPAASPTPSPAAAPAGASQRADARYAAYQRDRQDQGFPDSQLNQPVPVKDQAPTDRPAAQSAEPTKIKIGDTELSEKQWLEIAASKAAADLQKINVPATADKYELKLPADLKLPEGISFQVAGLDDPVKGPVLKAAQEWAHRNGLSQDQFSQALGLYAAATAHEQMSTHAIAKAEAEKLGVSGPARIDAISMFMRANFGDAAARPMLLTLSTASQVATWETIIRRLTNGGSASFSTTGREAPEPQGGGRKSEAEVSRMSAGERLDYSRQFNQAAMPGWRDPRAA
jgi:hypothetical protein